MMRLNLLSVFLVGFIVAITSATLTPAMVTYDLNTPESVLTEAKDEIVKAVSVLSTSSCM